MSAVADFSNAEIERGRRLFAGDWSFLSAASSVDSLPRPGGLEIAFAGRSNVGKSSLINALTGRRALARTSNRPGRTQELIFFGGADRLVLVDLPGYGYAAAAKSKVAAWTRLIHDYLHGRAALGRVYVLIDARHGLKPVDEAILDKLGEAAVSYQIVLTKCDQVSEDELAKCSESVSAGVRKRPAAFPDLIATAAHTGAGVPELRAAIARLLAERRP
jgi:GTP-binding protein